MFKFSFDWLKDYCGKDVSYDDVMRKLRTQGFEFQGSKKIGEDVVTAIEVKANRPDMLSHMGIAREVKAFDGEKIPNIKNHDIPIVNNDSFAVKISAEDGTCERFCALKMSGVNASAVLPEYITRRLNALGINSVNPVVDICNYVMLDIGQPMHCYDFSKISNKELNVHLAKHDENIVTFAGETAEVKTGDIVISDADGIKCVAGIIGCESAAVTNESTDIILESAVFEPVNIRLASRRMKISTPSSFRFERGVSSENSMNALLECAEMIKKFCGGVIESNVFDYYPKKSDSKFLDLNIKNNNALIGANLSEQEVINCLEKYGFECTPITENELKVKIPNYRLDLKQEVDLIEEVARIYGYDNIEPVMPTIMTSYRENLVWDNISLAREVLCGLGFNETINYAFIPGDTMKNLGIAPGDRLYSDISIQNPISGAYALMRPNMVYSLVNCLAYNYSIGNSNLALFELGRVYFRDESIETKCKEIDTCAFVMSGVRLPRGFGVEKDVKYTYYDLLGYIKVVMDRFGESFELKKNDYAFCEEGSGFDIVANGKAIGFIGELNKSKLNKIQNAKLIKDKIFFCEFYLNDISEKTKKIKFQSKYPPVKRLYNLVQRKDVSAKEVKDCIKSTSEVIRGITVNDIYSDKTFSDNEYAVLYEVNYGSKTSTLTTEEIENIENEFLNKLSAKFGAHLKS